MIFFLLSFYTFSQVLTLSLAPFIESLKSNFIFIQFINFFLILVKNIKGPTQYLIIWINLCICTINNDLRGLLRRRYNNRLFPGFLKLVIFKFLVSCGLFRDWPLKGLLQILLTLLPIILQHILIPNYGSLCRDLILQRRRCLFLTILDTSNWLLTIPLNQIYQIVGLNMQRIK